MVYNQTLYVILNVISENDYIYNVIDHDYNAFRNGDYDHLWSCNRLQLTTITDYE